MAITNLPTSYLSLLSHPSSPPLFIHMELEWLFPKLLWWRWAVSWSMCSVRWSYFSYYFARAIYMLRKLSLCHIIYYENISPILLMCFKCVYNFAVQKNEKKFRGQILSSFPFWQLSFVRLRKRSQEYKNKQTVLIFILNSMIHKHNLAISVKIATVYMLRFSNSTTIIYKMLTMCTKTYV